MIIHFSGISNKYFKQDGSLAIFELNGLISIDIEESKGFYDVWFNTEPLCRVECVFFFEGLTNEEYHELIEIVTSVISFVAEIPK